MKRYWQRREDINKLHNSPKYRKLRRLLYIVTFIVVLIQLAMIIWMDDLSFRTILWMRGCVGVGAICIVIIGMVWSYRVYTDYFQQKIRKRK